ncbi:MAG: DUF748 domain-containing protein [Kiloniellaceae bacterium]
MPADTPASPPSAAKRRRRLAIRAGIGAGIALLLFVLVVFVLPTPLARYVIEAQLENLGIQHDGIDTVDIDLWNSHVRAGPVQFHAGNAERGQIGDTGFDYSFGAFFKGRAFVQTFYLSGVDLHIARLEDGAIEINGINLREIAGRQDAAAAEPASETDDDGGSEDGGFQFGVERFEFTDSQLVFEDVGGGTAVIDLDRLTLNKLLTWTPEAPTTFALEGRLNEMQLSLDGTVTPLDDPLLLTFHSRISGITLDRVARFVGPTGLARQSGTLDTDVNYAYSIHRDGRIEGTVDGSYNFTDFEIATPEGETAALGKALLKVDLRQSLQSDGSASAIGQLTLDAAPLSVATARGDAVEIGGIKLAFADLDFRKDAEPRRRLWEPEASATTTDKLAQGVPTIVELMVGWVRDLGREALDHHLTINGLPSLTLEDGMIRVAARDGVPGQELRFDDLSVNLGTVASQAFDGGWSATGGLESAISALRLITEGGKAEASLSALQVNADAVDLRATAEETRFAFDLKLLLDQLAAHDDQGGTLDLGALSLASQGVTIKETVDREEATGPLTLSLRDLSATLPGADGAMTLRGEAIDLDFSPFSLVGKGGESANVDGSVTASGLSLGREGDSPLALALTSAQSDLQGLRAAPLGPLAEITGGLTTTLSGISVEVGLGNAGPANGGQNKLSLTLETLSDDVTGLRASGFDGGDISLSLASHSRLSGLSASLPLADGGTAEATIASLDAPFSELGLSGQIARGKGALEITGISAQSGGDTPQSLDLASLSVSGIAGDSESGAEAERIALGKLVAKLALPRAMEPAPGTTETQTADTGGGTAGEDTAAGNSLADALPPGKRFRIGAFTLAAGSTIEVTDSNVEPPLQASIVVEDLKAGPLDTAAPEAHTDIALALSVNEGSKAQLHGWAAPLKAKPDFDLASQVDGLLLTLLSPYAAKATGVNIESGELFAEVKATAAEGDLGGGVDLHINDLFVTPLSEEDAEKIKAGIGLPVGFAVSILKNDEGVIAFDLPLGGTVAAPEVDYSEAIDKAISGAMASVFPTNWFGPDGNTFEMQPAPFAPGTAELTEDGRTVTDQMGTLFANKPGISIRACGRAGRADLVALRGGPADLPSDPVDQSSDVVTPAGAAPAGTTPKGADPNAEVTAALTPPDKGIAPAPEKQIAAPSDAEVQALLTLATERGAAVRKYLEAKYSIDPDQIPECRNAYSIEDGKPPRAEFQF